MNRPVTAPTPVDYPCSDGQPMAESDFQLEPLVYAITALRTHFHHRKKVYVAGDMFLYHEEGNPGAVVAPDVFVVVGAPVHKRMSYKLWEEPKAPDFVLEVTSRSTRKEDQGRKREVYASLGVGEYWLFDPTGDYLAPRLQGFRLHGGEYRSRLAGRRRPGSTRPRPGSARRESGSRRQSPSAMRASRCWKPASDAPGSRHHHLSTLAREHLQVSEGAVSCRRTTAVPAGGGDDRRLLCPRSMPADVSRPGPTSRAAYVPIGDGRSPASLSPFPFHRTRHGYGTVTLHVPRRPEASLRRTRR